MSVSPMTVPRWYGLALAERGVKEAPGAADDPGVQAYYRDAGHKEVSMTASLGARPLSAPCSRARV